MSFGSFYPAMSMEFSRHEYRSGLPFPSPGDVPDPGIELAYIAPHPVESREAHTKSTVSLSSQRHNEKLPEVTGTSRGNPGFSAMTREIPRSSLLPPHTIPLGRPSAPAPSIQCHASNLDWRLETLVPSRDSRARTRSPSPRAWRPDFPGAAREAP